MIIYSNIENVNSKTAPGEKSSRSMAISSFLGASGSGTGTQKKTGLSVLT